MDDLLEIPRHTESGGAAAFWTIAFFCMVGLAAWFVTERPWPVWITAAVATFVVIIDDQMKRIAAPFGVSALFALILIGAGGYLLLSRRSS